MSASKISSLEKLSDLVANPSGLDSLANYAGSIPDPEWLVVLTRSRDSDILTESNFECALSELGGESETVNVFRFGHWACGWWEALAVQSGSEEEKIALKIKSELDDYPVLDEADFYGREQEEADSIWRDCYTPQERLKYIRENRNEFDFHDFKHLMGCVRGEYFLGYASELIG